MSRLMVAFIDGLAHSRVNEEIMPFVGSLPRLRVRTQAGFSTTCWGNLFTGVYPEQHGHWFQVVCSPETSPFGPAAWIPRAAYRFVPPLGRMAWLRFLSLRRRNRSVFGYPFMHFVDPHLWRFFDVVESKVFGEPGFYAPHKYLFEYLDDHGLRWALLGVHRELRRMQQGVDTVRLQLAANPDLRSPDLVFALFADIDYLSHYTGPDSPEVRGKLREIDGFIADIYRRSGGDRELIVLSDHGHLKIEKKIDIYEHVPDLRDRVHQVEDMYVRVWTPRPEDRASIAGQLVVVPGLSLLADDDVRRHRLPTDRDRHGHVIGVLDPGASFLRTSWTRHNRFLSDHGYLPGPEDLDAFVAGTCLRDEARDAELVDVLPSILEVLGLRVDAAFTGSSLVTSSQVPFSAASHASHP
jgi:type I phosphodiesterase/nucleotide pyrophosphatase